MSFLSKEELKKQYQIADDDFALLTELPSETEVKEKGFLIKLAEASGAQTWMWKSFLGIVLAIIFITPQLKDTFDFWKPKVVASYSYFYDYYTHRSPSPQPAQDSWVAFTMDVDVPPTGSSVPSLSALPPGSGVYPMSGWNPNLTA